MIPVGLAAARAAYRAWRESAGTLGPNPVAALNDEDLGEIQRALCHMRRELDEGIALTSDLIVRRLMATSARVDIWPAHQRNGQRR